MEGQKFFGFQKATDFWYVGVVLHSQNIKLKATNLTLKEKF